MKLLKYSLIAAGGIMVVLGGLAAYLAATFDPNAYKPQIIQLVKDKKQRTLKLDGDIKLSLWPGIGANLGRLSLSELKSEKEFAAVESARVSLKLLPLLSRQLVVDEIVIKGVRASLVRYKDGRMNIDDLLAKDEQKQEQFKFDIDHVIVENAALAFRDDAKGAQYALTNVNLRTGRIANGVSSKVAFSAAVQGNQPKMNLTVDLKTQFTLDTVLENYVLAGLALEAKGQAADIANLVVKAGGDITAKLKSGEFAASKLSVAVTGISGKDSVDIRLDAPRINLAADKASGEKVTVVAKITGPQGATSASLVLPGIEGTAQAFKSAGMTLDLDIKQGDLAVKAKVSSPVSGNLQVQQLSLPGLKASIVASGPNLPGKSFSGELAGSAVVDGAKQTAQTQLAGKVSDSQIKARVSVASFSNPAIHFDLDIDQLDLDRYAGAPPAAGAKQPEKPFDLTALRALRASGAVRIGSLKASNVKATNVRLEIKAGGGKVDLSPLSANLYQGSLSGAVSVNAAPATPTFAIQQNLAGVSVGPLLKDLANQDSLEGRGNVALNVTTQGNTVTALKKALNGSAGVRLADGAVKGIDVAGSIRHARAKLGALRGEHVQQTDKSQKTDFSELTANFAIRNGVASNNDLSLKSPLLRVGGEGDINIGEDLINYLVKAAIVATSKGQGGREADDLKGVTVPVRVTGPLGAPSYKLDFSAMVTDAAKQKLEQAVKGRLEERLGGVAGKGQPPAAAPGAAKEPAKSGDKLRDGLRSIIR